MNMNGRRLVLRRLIDDSRLLLTVFHFVRTAQERNSKRFTVFAHTQHLNSRKKQFQKKKMCVIEERQIYNTTIFACVRLKTWSAWRNPANDEDNTVRITEKNRKECGLFVCCWRYIIEQRHTRLLHGHSEPKWCMCEKIEKEKRELSLTYCDLMPIVHQVRQGGLPGSFNP